MATDWQPRSWELAVAAPRVAPGVASMVGYRTLEDASGVHLGLPSSSLTFNVSLDDGVAAADTPERLPAARPNPVVLGGLHLHASHVRQRRGQAGVQLAVHPLWIELLPEDDTDTGYHYLLIRRNDKTRELAYLRCYAPRPATLHTLVTVAGQRWRIEESFQAAKGLVGLDQHQVRRWASWHRWTTLAMLAHAFLAVATATERDRNPTPEGLITLTVNEFRRLFDALLLVTKHTVTSLLAWSRWRRQHQYRARLCHYRQHQDQ